jgi:drug/metabolite transporter (DMT)-like permease
MNKKNSRQEKISIDFRIIMAIITTLIFWASAFAGIRVGLKAYNPENLVLFRFLTASIVLLVYAIITRMPLPEKKDLPVMFFLSFIGITVYHLALTFGELKVTADSTSLLIAWIWLGEMPFFLSLAGGALALTGVIIVNVWGR